MAKRILIVEDCEVNAELLRWILEDEGYETILVESGEDCLELVRTQTIRFDLVLMDISLPGIDGRETTRQLRELPDFTNLPIVACTAQGLDSEIRAIMAAGLDGVIHKPFDETAMLQYIEEAIDNKI